MRAQLIGISRNPIVHEPFPFSSILGNLLLVYGANKACSTNNSAVIALEMHIY